MYKVYFPLVGSHFRGPPAKQLLSHLPSNAGLRLLDDSENPYDDQAIKVLVQSQQVPESRRAAFDDDLANTGWTAQDCFDASDYDEKGLIFVGFVGASGGKPCREAGLPGNRELRELITAQNWAFGGVPAKLAFSAEGKILLSIDVEEKA